MKFFSNILTTLLAVCLAFAPTLRASDYPVARVMLVVRDQAGVPVDDARVGIGGTLRAAPGRQ